MTLPAVTKKIAIVTPAKPGTLHGNRTTALRWEKHLNAAGFHTDVFTDWTDGDQDVMVALHAARSHHAIFTWKSRYPEKPLILIMTGTDLYRDLPIGNADALASIKLADRLVLLQPEAIHCLPRPAQTKCRVIYQSITPRTSITKHKKCFMVSVIGHLRAEKDPFRTALALRHIPDSSRIQVMHIGMAMTDNFSQQARALESLDVRYHWLGQRSHSNTLRWLSSSHLMVISSLMEGGAHVVSEAIALGVPVLASDIAGNRGLLGQDYPGFFPTGNDAALAKLLMRAESEPDFLRELTHAIEKRQPLITPSREFESIIELMHELSVD